MDPIIGEDIQKIIDSVGSHFNLLQGKKILVTGADGFLPSYLVDTFAVLNRTSLSHNPVSVFLLNRRAPENSIRLKHHIGNPHIKFLQGDVAAANALPSGINFIIHGASRSSPKDYLANPLDTIDANTVGTRVLLEYALKNPLEGFLFLSTVEVYGEPDEKHIPIAETYRGNVDVLGERAVYQESKRFGETLCRVFFASFGVPAKIARIFHTYGPRLNLSDGRVIPEFMRRCLASEDLEIIRGGSSIRTFAYVSDTIAGIWKILLQGKSGEAYNVGSDEEITVENLAKLYMKMFNNTIRIKMPQDFPPAHLAASPSKSAPDLRKIRSELGYEPRVSIADGLARLKQWYELYGNL